MARTNNLFKVTYNALLGMVEGVGARNILPSNLALSNQFGVSTTTIKAAMAQMNAVGIIDSGNGRTIARVPGARDYFPEDEIEPVHDRIRADFLHMVAVGELPRRAKLNETDLARQLDVTIYAVRNFLQDFSRFGLVLKEPNRHWVFVGLEDDALNELFDARELFEAKAIKQLASRPLERPEVMRVGLLQQEHLEVLRSETIDKSTFYAMDMAFHNFIAESVQNRFAKNVFETLNLVLEIEVSAPACEPVNYAGLVVEHLAIIGAILSQNEREAVTQLRAHLKQSRDIFFAGR